ncbi:hypothetical protein [Gordonia malaquae]|uniref:hypothetical protein n=1 Tax=Gordonia malaquae TaxID=410332 RepID=UPI00301889F0
MYSVPNQQSVIDDLGDKFLGAFVDAVVGAKDDLEAFRERFPAWFVNFSKRFIANFIHERMWDRMIRQVSDHPGVQIVDKGSIRQIIVDQYVIRFKRHRPKMQISTYPTAGALAFWTNKAMIPGTETHSLALGYIWDVDEAEIKNPILSYRSALDTPEWSVELDAPGPTASGTTPIGWKPLTPDLPQIDLSEIVDDDAEGDASTS